MDQFELFQALAKAEEESARSADLLFGCDCEKSECTRCNPPEDESAIIFDSDLSLEDKLARLQVLRGAKQVKPKSFRKRVTRGDEIHARALGIRLD